jgi:hypothetical protein
LIVVLLFFMMTFVGTLFAVYQLDWPTAYALHWTITTAFTVGYGAQPEYDCPNARYVGVATVPFVAFLCVVGAVDGAALVCLVVVHPRGMLFIFLATTVNAWP